MTGVDQKLSLAVYFSFMKNVGTALLLKHKYKENLDYRFGLAFI